MPQFYILHMGCEGFGAQIMHETHVVPFRGLVFYMGAVLYWGPKKDPDLENYPQAGTEPCLA